jgi:hypothetical protein
MVNGWYSLLAYLVWKFFYPLTPQKTDQMLADLGDQRKRAAETARPQP